MIARRLRRDRPARRIRFWRNPFFLAAILPAQGVATARPEEVPLASSRVLILPVFFVPQGKAAPSRDQSQRLMRHLHWSQTRYREMLRGVCTFEIGCQEPVVFEAPHDLAWYRSKPQGTAPYYVAELLQHFKEGRTSCRSIYLIIVMNPHDNYPNGGARPINGGFGTGGGVVTLSSYALDEKPNFQSTLQHELGHSFGLPHVDTYGYDMKTNPSIMSYNLAQHTDGFTPSPTPGTLIPEDLRGLAMNQRVFPGLRFDPQRDVPKGYHLHGVVKLGPMDLPELELLR